MAHLHRILICAAAWGCVSAAAVFAQAPVQSSDPLKEGEQHLRDGRLEPALAAFEQAMQASPSAMQPHLQAGIVLDLLGRYADARPHFAKAIDLAESRQDKSRAQRAMAMSYAFEGDCAGAARYEQPQYDTAIEAKDFVNAGEIANELARVCLESGDLNQATSWYGRGHDAGLQDPDIKPDRPDRKDLWEFRWEHAQARIAARKGDKAAAQQHMAAAKAVLDRGTNPNQAPFFPYLAGYVAFYGGDYQTARTELERANQDDPFILALLAQTYEKLGDEAHAAEYYRKVLSSTAHNPANAYARPLALRKTRS
jgi:Flp pilus assembly protein TadD